MIETKQVQPLPAGELRRLQLTELELLIEFDRICRKNNIRYTEFLPEYKIHGRYAPLKRNLEIIDNADFVLAFWDGKSRGTKFVIDNCRKINKPIRVLISKGCL